MRYSPARVGTLAARAAPVALLAFHLATRLLPAFGHPYPGGAFYSTDYEVALALAGGRGFTGLGLNGDRRPEAHAARRFLRFKRESLPRELVERLAAGATETPAPPLASTRVLELRTAGALFRWLGARWSVVAGLHVALSTLAALAVFLVARSIAGHAAACLALLLLAASPFEALWATTRIRDLSPLWFDAFGLGAVALVRLDGSLARRVALVGAAGAITALGFGWRTDGLLLPPLAALLLLLRIVEAGCSRRAGSWLLVAFTAGAFAGFGGIRALGPVQPLTPAIGFHIAQYGGATRANILEVENSLQTGRQDAQARFETSFFAGRSLEYGTPDYAVACRRLYLEILPYVAYRWVTGYPGVFQAALEGFPAPGELHGITPEDRGRVRFRGLDPAYRLLELLTLSAPALYWLGLLVLLLVSLRPLTVLGLALFGFAYGGVLLAVLPETKHTGPLLVPLAVFAGAGLAALAQPSRLRAAWQSPRKSRLGVGVLVALAAFAGSAGIAWRVSLDQRRAYLDLISSLPRAALDPASERLGAGRFAVRRSPGAQPDPVGYLLDVEGPHATATATLRVRRGLDAETPQRLFVSRHPLVPSARQQVFFVCFQGLAIDDERSVECALEVPQGARLVSGQRVDLAGWKRPLFATSFGGGLSPGPPRLPHGTLSTEFGSFEPPSETMGR